MYVAKDQKDWDEHIPLILFAHRTSICEVIGDSPFYVLYGRELRLPIYVKLLPKESLNQKIYRALFLNIESAL